MSSSFVNWFGRSKKQVSHPEPEQNPPAAPKPAPRVDHQPGAPYKKGDSFHEISEFFENSEIWLGLISGACSCLVRPANRACPSADTGAEEQVVRYNA